MNFHSSFPALFHMQLCKCHANILSCVHQRRGCDKRYQCQSQCQSRGGGVVGREMCIKESKAWSVARTEVVVRGWPIPCRHTWPLFMVSKHHGNTHFLASSRGIFFQQNCCFFMFLANSDCFSSKYCNFWWKKFQKHHLAQDPHL